jgi:fluoride exporter
VRIFLVMLFGALGAGVRYGLQGVVYDRTGAGFPTGTLAVNLLGCLALGAMLRYAFTHLGFPPEWRIAIAVGFLGSFTTFSTFGWETVRLLEDGEWLKAGAYVGLSVLGGIVAVMLGIRIGDAF